MTLERRNSDVGRFANTPGGPKGHKLDRDIEVLNEDIAYLMDCVMLGKSPDVFKLKEIGERQEQYRAYQRQGG